jgi:MFS family permease
MIRNAHGAMQSLIRASLPALMQATRRQEWAAMWPLPVLGLWGIAGSAIIAYSSGVFMIEMTKEFAWTRTQFSSALTLQFLLGLVVMPAVGRATDRLGARRVALTGIIPFMLALAMLGAASGAVWQWLLLVICQGLCVALVSPTIWLTPVVARFRASRGLALAVALAGVGLATALWPLLAAIYMTHFGWRLAFLALALTWGVLAVPLTIRFFFGASEVGSKAAQPTRSTRYGQVLRSRTFLFLIASGALFSSVTFGLTVHLVPILRGNGLDLQQAAAIAVMAGLCAIAGRVGTGFLLDSMPLRPLSTAVFLLPALVSILLHFAGSSLPAAVAAVALLGLASGAEMDIVTFLAARQFGQEIFASIYSIIMSVLAVCASLGPLLAAALFDARGSYGLYLLLTVPMVIVAAVLIRSLPPGAPAE